MVAAASEPGWFRGSYARLTRAAVASYARTALSSGAYVPARAAAFNRAIVGHRDRQPAIAPLEIREQSFKSAKQVLAAGLKRSADDLWIGRYEVGR